MSKELIDAIKSGKLNEVEAVFLANPNVDISVEFGPSHAIRTPLGYVLMEGYWDIAKFLIKKGAKLEQPNCTDYSSDMVSKFPYIFGIAMQKWRMEKQTFKMLLARVTVLNPIFRGWDGPQPRCLTNVSEWETLKNQSTLTPIAIHEAFVRGDANLIVELLNKKQFSCQLTPASLQDHIEDRKFTYQQVQAMRQTIFFLKESKMIIDGLAREVEEYLDTLLPEFDINIHAFPEKLRAQLSDKCDRNLSELFVEFQSLLYPEENLPPISINSLAFKQMNSSLYNPDHQLIAGMQNPILLRSLLDCEETTILMRLANGSNQMGESHAVFLLAMMILLHSNTLITDKDKETPLLNKKQQQRGISVINTLYQLTRTEKMMVQISQQQKIELTIINGQNEELKEQNGTLQSKVEGLSERLANMEKMLAAALDKLTGLANEQSHPIRPGSPTLFYKKGLT